MARFFDTQAPQQFRASGLSGLVDRASASPLNAIGKTMSELDAIATQRGKEKYSASMAEKMKGITSTEDLLNLGYDRTKGTDALGSQFDTQAKQLSELEKLKDPSVDFKNMQSLGFPMDESGWEAYNQAKLSKSSDKPMSGYPNSFKEWTLSGSEKPYGEWLEGQRANLTTVRDADGIERVVYIPRGTGEAIDVKGGTKVPKISKEDIATSKEIPLVNDMMKQFDEFIPSQEEIDAGKGDAPGFGLADTLWGKTTGALGVNTSASQRTQEVATITSKVMGILGKQEMKGVLSDQDLKFIKETIPSPWDSEAQARTKIDQIKELWDKQVKAYNKRISRTHPQYKTNNTVKFIVGKIYTDEDDNKAEYQADGTWKEIPDGI